MPTSDVVDGDWRVLVNSSDLHDGGISNIRPSSNGKKLTMQVADAGNAERAEAGLPRVIHHIEFRDVPYFCMVMAQPSDPAVQDLPDYRSRDVLSSPRDRMIWTSVAETDEIPAARLWPLHQTYNRIKIDCWAGWEMLVAFRSVRITRREVP